MKEIIFPNEIFLPEVVKLINEGHTVTIRLRGFSMRPFLEDGRDKAKLGFPKNIKVGDVVLAEIRTKIFVLHRIIKIDQDNVILRGDGNILTEECKLKDIRAIALAFIRKGRKKEEHTSGIKWKLYSFVWVRLFPIRRYLLAFYKRIWIKFFGPL